ncbi:MAG: AAA family ATPase [Nanoarchaeota archaeon]|nr:AAA family ATPase [Nanoarchaeota archaeon]
MFYVIEGIDGAGKTSVGNKLSEISNINYLETPCESFKRVNSRPDDSDFHGRFDYYMRGNLYTINKLNQNSLNVVGRYYFSTIIGNSLLHNISFESVESIARMYNPEEPVNTFLLTVDEDEQLRRIKNRNKGKHTLNDSNILYDINYRVKMRGCYIAKAKQKKWHILDTTDKSIDQLAKEILQSIC